MAGGRGSCWGVATGGSGSRHDSGSGHGRRCRALRGGTNCWAHGYSGSGGEREEEMM